MIDEFSKLLLELSQIQITKTDIEQAIECLDLTNLKPESDWAQIFKLCEQANQYNVASLCILPQHINQARPLVKTISTVVNFHQGNHSIEQIRDAIDQACELGADEIDCVLDYTSYIKGNDAREDALKKIETLYKQCNKNNLCFKVILETSEFTSIEAIYQASLDIIEAGCDFIKTSTGTSAVGASFDAAFAILKAIKSSKKKSVGIKISGGIDTTFQAIQYMELSKRVLGLNALTPQCFRLGASRLLNELIADKAVI